MTSLNRWLPGKEFVAGGGGEEGYGGGAGLQGVAGALDGLRTGGFGDEEGLFGLAEDDDRRAAQAGGDSEAGGEADGVAVDMEGRAEDIDAQALGHHDGVGAGAAGEGHKELVLAGAAEQVVAAQEARGAGCDLAEQIVACLGAEARVPVAEVVDVEENEAEGAFHALDAVGFAKEHGEHGFAVVDAGEVVGLGVEGGGFAEEFELAEAAMAAQDGFEAKAQEGRFDGARGEVVDDALGETIDPLLGDGVRGQDNGEAPAGRLGAGRGKEAADFHAGQVDVDEGNGGRMGCGQRREGGFGGENDFNARARGEQDRLNSR